jgi:hypothetical protein
VHLIFLPIRNCELFSRKFDHLATVVELAATIACKKAGTPLVELRMLFYIVLSGPAIDL